MLSADPSIVSASPLTSSDQTRADAGHEGSVAASTVRQALILILVVLVVGLPPRLLDADRFVTTDELFWMGRTGGFARALATGQLGATFQSGHPGVTTMWTALLGAGPDLVGQLAGSRREVSRREVSEHPAFMPALAAARRGFGVETALGTVLAALLAWRLFGYGPALLGGALLALDPFFLAHSRLAHIDASLAIWMTVAVLAGLARASGGGAWIIAVSGAATALALLSKSPALSLALFVPLALLVPRLRRRPDTPCDNVEPGEAVTSTPRAKVGATSLGPVGWAVARAVAKDVLVWAAITVLVYVALWPAMWVAPLETLRGVFGFVGANANAEHAAAADSDGLGILFYPLVFLLRSTPLTLLGLVALLVLRPRGTAGRAALVLGLVAIGFAAVMTVAAKGFDRYLLPIFPALDLLAGLGIWRAISRVVPTRPRVAFDSHSAARHHIVAGAVVVVVVVGLSAWWVAGASPYGLTYANPVFGGLPAAHRMIASGWGEGLDQAAAYLNAKPDAERLKVGLPGEIYTTVLGAQLAGQVGPIDAASADPSAWDYVVVYTRNLQSGDRPAFLDGSLVAWAPEHTVTLNGVEYAWIYDAANGVPVGATYGGMITLEGYGVDTATARLGRRLDLRLYWRAPAALPPGLSVQFELQPTDGRPGPRAIYPLSGEQGGRGRPDRFAGRYELPVDPSIPPGGYMVTVRVIDQAGTPLPLTAEPHRAAGAPAQRDAVALRTILVR